MDDNKCWHEDRRGMEEIVVSYFTMIFSSSGVANFEDILCNIMPSVIEEMNNYLDSPFTDKEIKWLCLRCIIQKHRALTVCLRVFIKNIRGW